MTTTLLAPAQNWDDVTELFAQAMPGYTERVEQTRLAHTIESAFEGTDWLLAQAGCGTGKSFAGLVPAILWSLKTGETVAVATATKALQSQYASKDLPFLQKLFADNGVDFSWSVLKGRGSYLCKDKLASDEVADVFNIEALKEELESDEFHSGDLDDLVTEVNPRQKLKLVSTSDECPGKAECPFGDVCFVEKAREKAKKANIVVVNHSLLIADSLVRVRTQGERGLLPDIGAIVVDECFPAGTLVDGRPIEEIKVGDTVSAFDEKTGQMEPREVTRLYRNPVGEQLVEVTVAGRTIVATPGHPFWTQRGWVDAIDLTDADNLLIHGTPTTSSSAHDDLRMVRSAVHTDRPAEVRERSAQGAGVLSAGALDGVAQRVHAAEARGRNGQRGSQPSYEGAESHGVSCGEGEGQGHVEGNGAQAPGAWRERLGDDRAAEVVARNAGQRVVFRVRGAGGDGADKRVADALQAGSGASAGDDRRGSRRGVALLDSPQGFGREEGQVLAWARVDRVQVHQRAGDDRFDGLCPDGHVYNIEVEGLHTYTAHDVVVHNCHELENYASSALGSRITRNGLKFLGRDVAKLLGDARDSFSLDRATDTLFDGLAQRLGRARNLRLRHDDDRVMVPILQTLVAVKDQLGDLVAQLGELDVHGDDKKRTAKKRMLKRVGSMAEKIVEVASADDAALVRWLSKETTRDGEDVVLEYAPLQVGEFLRKNLWNTIPVVIDDPDSGEVRIAARKRPVVLMSATLAIGQDFTFLATVLGMDEGFEGFDAGTPFDFAKQAKVYIPKAKTTKNPRGFADPTRDDFTWRAQAQKVMRDLIEASGGRTLVLFTSRSAMLEAKTALEDYIVDDLGLTLLVQGEGTNRELADRFRTEETSVLFGMNSFMTGLDVQGDSLRTVILDKVPFTSPDDVLHAARCEAMDRAVAARKGYHGSLVSLPSTIKFHPEAGFNGRSVPEATLVMVQAMGRGVRTATDEALLVVLDPRINPVGGKNYAKSMVAALPRTQRLEDLGQAKAYLGELAARRDG